MTAKKSNCGRGKKSSELFLSLQWQYLEAGDGTETNATKLEAGTGMKSWHQNLSLIDKDRVLAAEEN